MHLSNHSDNMEDKNSLSGTNNVLFTSSTFECKASTWFNEDLTFFNSFSTVLVQTT